MLLALGVTAGLRAEVSLGVLFGDHAVLQRDRPVAVWGTAAPGEKISVSFHGRFADAVAGSDGRWQMELPAFPASADGADLIVTGTNTVTAHDVVVGEVWLCSGQSNMEVPVKQARNASAEIAAATNPLIRHFKVARRVGATAPGDVRGEWERAAPATAGNFTAVGYFFARELYQRLQVPIGLVNSSWGGTPVESWIDPEALASLPLAGAVAQRWQKTLQEYPARKAEYDIAWTAWESRLREAHTSKTKSGVGKRPAIPEGPGHEATPTGLYTGMIAPLLPLTIRGVIWYQGEANVSRGAAEYRVLFPAMIRGWRAHFGAPELPFYWVQLPNFNTSGAAHTERAELREAQAAALALPATGQAVTIDIGEPTNNHPKNKQDVSRRLALIAAAQLYGAKEECVGPTFAKIEHEGNWIRVRFTHARGLHATGASPGTVEIAGADRKFVAASARVEGETMLVNSASVPEPVAVRYAWQNAPDAFLYNDSGLPAVPFRSDAWQQSSK